MAVLAVTTTSASVAAMVVVGVQGHSAAVPGFRSAAPWPPWFVDSARSPAYVSVALWGAVLLGGTGLAAGLLAVRRGWRPRPGWLVAGSFAAVVALTVIPPMGSTDMLDYAVYGRIAASGHSPYRMTPLQLKASGDPVGAVAPHPWATRPSVYGPLATATEWAASELAGGSAARTVFWLKVWNGLAYLALVLALDRLVRSSAARRVRAHVVWSVNPLMLWAVVAGGHIDGLGAALAVAALLTLRRARETRPEPRRGLLAGVLLGAASAVKASFVLADPGLVWAARRSRATLAAMGLGMLAALMCLFSGYFQVGDFEVPVEGLPERRIPVGEAGPVGLAQQPPERRSGGRLMRAGLFQAPRLAGHLVGSGVDVHAERPARQLLDVASDGVGHGRTITRSGVIRSTTPFHAFKRNVRLMPLNWSRLSESNR